MGAKRKYFSTHEKTAKVTGSRWGLRVTGWEEIIAWLKDTRADPVGRMMINASTFNLQEKICDAVLKI